MPKTKKPTTKKGPSSAFGKAFAKMKKRWKAAVASGGFDLFPEGVFDFRLQNLEVVKSKKGNWQIHRESLCLDGEHKGKVLHDYLQLETEYGPDYIVRFMGTLGYEADEDQMEETLEQMAADAPCFLGQVKHSGDFANLRVIKLLEESNLPEDDDDDDEGEYEGDDDEGDDEGEYEGDDDEGDDEGEYEGDDEGDDDEDDEGDDEDEALLDQLTEFADTHEIEPPRDGGVEDLTEAICGFEWDKTELTEDEVDLLTSIGADFVKPKKTKKKSKSKSKSKK